MLSLKKKLMIGASRRIRPQDVFATSLYTGTGSTQTITNGLDLAGKGGLVWTKNRVAANSHTLWDTQRGARKALQSDATIAENDSGTNGLQSFNPSGFTLGPSYSGDNTSGSATVAWSFRRAPKFFDVVTYTGNGVAGRQIPHGLGVVPGMIVVKRRDAASEWFTRHRSATGNLYLNRVDAQDTGANLDVPAMDAATFTLRAASANISGAAYVAYVFAQNPDLIDCGGYVGNGASTVVTCGSGWRPQWLMVKCASRTSDWSIFDSARGFATSNASDPRLAANSSASEQAGVEFIQATSTGFTPTINDNTVSTPGETYVYLAIRSPT